MVFSLLLGRVYPGIADRGENRTKKMSMLVPLSPSNFEGEGLGVRGTRVVGIETRAQPGITSRLGLRSQFIHAAARLLELALADQLIPDRLRELVGRRDR